MSSSPDGICLVSDNESRLGVAELDSPSPSEDKFNAAVPDEDRSRCLLGASAEGDEEIL